MTPTDPLDYATGSTGIATPQLTEGQRRARKRRLLIFGLLLLIALVPYPTLICPSVQLQVVDPQGTPVNTIVSARWVGETTGGIREGRVPFDLRGSVSSPQQWEWNCTFGRLMARFSEFLPHSGGGAGGMRATISFLLPDGYRLDSEKMQLLPIFDYQGKIDGWTDPATGDGWGVGPSFYGSGDVLTITVRNLDKRRAFKGQVIVQKK